MSLNHTQDYENYVKDTPFAEPERIVAKVLENIENNEGETIQVMAKDYNRRIYFVYDLEHGLAHTETRSGNGVLTFPQGQTQINPEELETLFTKELPESMFLHTGDSEYTREQQYNYTCQVEIFERAFNAIVNKINTCFNLEKPLRKAKEENKGKMYESHELQRLNRELSLNYNNIIFALENRSLEFYMNLCYAKVYTQDNEKVSMGEQLASFFTRYPHSLSSVNNTNEYGTFEVINGKAYFSPNQYVKENVFKIV